MADSRRQQIFDAVVARLKLIKALDGYETDLGLKVFAWRDAEFDGESGELDEGACNVTDPKEDGEEGSIQPHTHDKTMAFEVFIATGKKNPSVDVQLRKMLADINKAIAVDRTWGNKARNTGPVSSEIGIKQEGKVYGGGKVTFTITYRHQAFDTYTA